MRNFINLFELKFVPVKKKSKLNVCFWIVSFQPASAGGFIELIDVSVWSTNVYL